MTSKRFYCYIDETGQDTKGKFFLVAVVIKEIEDLQTLQEKLAKIEKLSKKNLKWSKSSFKVRQAYLNQIMHLKLLRNAIFYSTYEDTKAYIPLTSLTIAKTILSQNTTNYTVNILIDGLKDKEMEEIRKDLKKLKITYSRIRGLKDEQDIILRLADSIAGFLRDCTEKQEYTKPILKRFKEKKIIVKV